MPVRNDENPRALAEAAKAKAIAEAEARGDETPSRAGRKAEDRALDAWLRRRQ
jgi:hypothetical protein